MKRGALTAGQLQVLQWIAEGCPAGRWRDDAHKQSARALETRNLARVMRRAGRWFAELTPDGRHYLEHGNYAPEPAPHPARSPTSPPEGPSSRPRRDEVDVEQMLRHLQKNGPLHITDPSPALRAAYRRAINAAITSDRLPPDTVLRHRGRDHGDLTITLTEALPERPTVKLVPVPDSYDPQQPAIAHLLAQPDILSMSEQVVPRALRIMQGLADSCARQGWTLEPPSIDNATFRVQAGEDTFNFMLTEVYDTSRDVSPEQQAGAHYTWQTPAPRDTIGGIRAPQTRRPDRMA